MNASLKKTILGCLLLVSFSTFSQSEFLWSYGTSQSDQGVGVIATSDGGYITSGNSYGNLLGNNSVNNLLIKLDSAGAVEWSVAADTNASNETNIVIEDPSDNGFIVAAYEKDGATQNYPDGNAWIYKVDANGNLVWSNVFGGDNDPVNSSDEFDDIIATSDGNFMAIGYAEGNSYTGGNGSFECTLYKFDSNGNILFARNIGNSNINYGQVIIEASDGNFVIGGTEYNGSTLDIMLCKINPTGTVLWSYSYGGSGFSNVGTSTANYGNTRPSHSALIETSDGGYAVCGYTNGYGSGNDDMIVVKTNSNGNLVFAKVYGDTGVELAAGIEEMPNNDLMVGGSFLGNLSSSNHDVALMRLNSTGDLIWAKSFQANSGGGPNEYAGSIQYINDGSLILTGTVNNSDSDGNDIFVWKTDTAGTADTCSGPMVFIPTDRVPTVVNITGTVTTTSLGYASAVITPVLITSGAHGFVTLTATEICYQGVVSCTPFADLGPDQSYCAGSSITLDAGFPGSTYLWNTGATTQTINVSTAGQYWVQITNGSGCVDSDTIQITENALPTVTLSAFAEVCVDAASFALSGGSPAGGTYSGTGVTSGSFNPATAGVGTHTITYDYTDGNGCSNSANETITVNALPTVTLSAFADVCVDAGAFALSGGSPAGGTYSGTGVTTGSFNPATAGVGTHTINYDYTDGNSCSNSANETITVNALPTVTLSAFADVCVDAASFALSGGSPVGGTYSGTAVTSGSFNPTNAGVGTHTISYDYTDGNGCSNSANETITVNDLPTVTLGAFADVCDGDASFTLTGGSPVGGTYSGTGVVGGDFDPATAGTGTHTITYTYTDGNGCSDFATSTITVNAGPAVTLANFSDVCQNDPVFNLSGGSPAGGTYAGPGVSAGQFDPATAGVGTHTISYTVTVAGCSGSDNNSITVNAQDDATFSYGQSNYCVLDADPTPTIGGTAGGNFTIDGSGVINAATGEIDVDASGVGNYTVTYVTTGICPDTATFAIQISNSLDPTINPSGPLCSNGPAVNLTAVDGGGTWSGNGITDTNLGTFDPAIAGVGTHTITYLISGACGSSDTEDIVVNAEDTASISLTSTNLCIDDTNPIPTVTGMTGGTFSITNGGVINATTGEVDVAASGAGTFDVVYTTNGICPVSDTVTITIDGGAGTAISSPTLFCFTQGFVNLTASPAGGTWSGNGITNPATGTFDPSTAGLGTHQIIYDLGTGGCGASDTINVEVIAGPNASISGNTSIDYGEITVLTASGGGTYLWSPDTGLDCDTCETVYAGPFETITYCVTVNVAGCVDTACTQITVSDPDCGEIAVPTAFSPNSGDVNATECVLGGCFTEIDFKIYDRWGELVFQTNDQNECWNGTHLRNGKPMSTGVYVYTLVGKTSDGQDIDMKGNITLIR